MRFLARLQRRVDFLIGAVLGYLIFSSAAYCQSTVGLEWNANSESDLAGYEVRVGTASGNYNKTLTTGLSTRVTLEGLVPGATYYCAVAAYNTASLAGPLSDEISFVAPFPSAPEISVESAPETSVPSGAPAWKFPTTILGNGGRSQDFTVRNTGTAPLTNLAIDIESADVRDFSISSSLPVNALAIQNGSFESGLEGWTVSGNVRASNSTSATAGSALAEFNYANSAPTGVVSRTLATVPGKIYTLSFDAGVLSFNRDAQSLKVSLSGNSPLLSRTLPLAGSGDGITRWTPQSLTFTADSTATTLSFADLSASTAAVDLRLDNVRVIPASDVPTASLEPGASATFRVAFSPSSPGAKSAQLHISNNDADENPYELSLSGNAVAPPEISISQAVGGELTNGRAVVNFSNSVPGTSSAAETLVIRNTGGSNLTGLTLTTQPAVLSDFVVSPLQTTMLAPGETTRVTAYFTPTSAGTKSASVRIASNDADENPFEIQLLGNGLAVPELALFDETGNAITSLSTIQTGSTDLGKTSAVRTLTIRNLGTANLTGLVLTRDGTNPVDFLIAQPAVSALAPGASTTFQITFKPTAAGPRTAQIHLASNDAARSPFHLSLAGTGIAVPEISISTAAVASLTDGASNVNFGNVLLGSTGPLQSFTIRNLGSAALSNLSLSLDGPHASDFLPGALSATSLAPGASMAITVAFNPKAEGTRSATLHLVSNDADENPFDILLEGTGGTVAEISVELADGTALANGTASRGFGNVDIGATSAPVVFTIRNRGTAQLSNLSLATDGAQSGDFTVSGLTVQSLAPGAATTFQAVFKPSAAGRRNAIIHLSSNDADENPFNIALAGNGVAVPEITVSLQDGGELWGGESFLDLGAVTVGSSGGTRVLSIKNTGAGILSGIAVSLVGADASSFTIRQPSVASLAPGASTTCEISFAPSATGLRTAALRIASNDADENPFDVRLLGTGGGTSVLAIVRPNGTWATNGEIARRLPNAMVDSDGVTETFALKNLGSVPLTGLAIRNTGPQAADFQITAPDTTTLYPGAVVTFQVTFLPHETGELATKLLFTSDDRLESPFTLALSGAGVTPPEIAVARTTGEELADGAGVIAFGELPIGVAGEPRAISVRNSGGFALSTDAVFLTGPGAEDFTVTTAPETPLTTGQSYRLRITFTPSAAGSRNAVLHIANNDPDESDFEISLLAAGIAAPEIAVSQTGKSSFVDGNAFVTFGSVTPGKSAKTRVVTITNFGTALLSGLKLSKSGLHGQDFTVGKLKRTSLPPGASTSFSISFKPSAGGNRWGALRIASNDADETSFDIVLAGRGASSAKDKKNSALGKPSLSTDPRVTRSVVVVDGEKYNCLTISWPAGQRDSREVIEVSPDLRNWFSGKNHTLTLLSTPTKLKVRDRLPLTPGGKRHIRLRPLADHPSASSARPIE